MKSGTSSLHLYLRTHPEIFMSSPKEPSHFIERSQLQSIWPEMERREYWKIEKYLALFENVGNAKYAGESSTNYTKLSRITGVAQRIFSYNSDAKIIYVMRDPVERTVSHYWHTVRLSTENREILRAVQKDRHYREVSHYAMQLNSYLELFGKENVMAITFEELVLRPGETLKQLFRWLQIDPNFVPPNLHERSNVTPQRMRQARGFGLLYGFRYSRVWGAIGHHSPAWVRAFGRRLSETNVVRDPALEKGAIKYLRSIQQAETKELRKLLGRDFPEWKTLYGDGL